MIRNAFAFAALVGAAACGGHRLEPAPSSNIRSDYYAMMFVGGRFGKPELSLHVLSDSVTTVLDSVVLTGLDASYDMWRRLASEGRITAANRTILETVTFGDSALRDNGRVVFARNGMRDTTMNFSSTWRRERAGWSIVLDSVQPVRR